MQQSHCPCAFEAGDVVGPPPSGAFGALRRRRRRTPKQPRPRAIAASMVHRCPDGRAQLRSGHKNSGESPRTSRKPRLPTSVNRHICRLTEVGKRGFRLVRGDSPEFLWPLRSWARPSGHRCTIDAAIALGRGCLGVRRLRRRRAPKAPEGGGPTTSPASKAQGQCDCCIDGASMLRRTYCEKAHSPDRVN